MTALQAQSIEALRMGDAPGPRAELEQLADALLKDGPGRKPADRDYLSPRQLQTRRRREVPASHLLDQVPKSVASNRGIGDQVRISVPLDGDDEERFRLVSHLAEDIHRARHTQEAMGERIQDYRNELAGERTKRETFLSEARAEWLRDLSQHVNDYHLNHSRKKSSSK